MFAVLKLIHIFLAINALGLGVAVCVRMLAGQSFEAWVRNFLRFTLVSASLGLILSIKHTSITQLLAMLTVYASGFAVFAWRKYRVSGSWGPGVVLSSISVFCLQLMIVTTHVFRAAAACNLLGPNEIHAQMPVFVASAILLFALLSIISLIRLHEHPIGPVMHKVAR